MTSLRRAVEQVLPRVPAAREQRPVLVGVDGMGGAGKSTLAAALAAELPSACVVHADDFYGPEQRAWRDWDARAGYERYFDHERLEAQLLQPLSAGVAGRFQRYDWDRRQLGDWVDVAAKGTVLVEGVYLLKPRLRGYWDLAIYVDAPPATRWRRLHARGEHEAGWIARWTAAEDYYLARDDPLGAADIVVAGW